MVSVSNARIEIDRVSGLQSYLLRPDGQIQRSGDQVQGFHSRVLVRADLLRSRRLEVGIIGI